MAAVFFLSLFFKTLQCNACPSSLREGSPDRPATAMEHPKVGTNINGSPPGPSPGCRQARTGRRGRRRRRLGPIYPSSLTSAPGVPGLAAGPGCLRASKWVPALRPGQLAVTGLLLRPARSSPSSPRLAAGRALTGRARLGVFSVVASRKRRLLTTEERLMTTIQTEFKSRAGILEEQAASAGPNERANLPRFL